jgi:hypothetical protein
MFTFEKDACHALQSTAMSFMLGCAKDKHIRLAVAHIHF